MYTDPTKPLPIATEKKDYIGVVYKAIIEIGNARYNNSGNMESLTEKVEAEQTLAEQRIAKFASDTDIDLKAHTDLRGPVHGETKESVGLGNVDNWPMASVAEHRTGTVKNKFAHPEGLAALVKDRLTIDPDLYIRSRILPLASGGNLGSVPQIDYRWTDGDIGDTLLDPSQYYGDTGFSFSTENGVRVYPSMTGAEVLTQVVASPGQPKTAITPLGGTQVRVYNRNIDMRRMRPSVLRGYSDVEPQNRLLQSSRNLFDRSALFYMEGANTMARSFNKIRLPFDILKAPNRGKNWDGILESRENLVYNIRSYFVNQDLGWGNDIYLVIKTDVFDFVDQGLDAKNGPGVAAEVIASLGQEYVTKTYTLPASGKFHSFVHPEGGNAICIKLRDIIAYTDTQKADLWAALNTRAATSISFAWSNRLKGVFTLRIPVGFYSKDATKYTSYYVDLMYACTEQASNHSVAINVQTLRTLDDSLQILSANLQVNKAGRFIEYPASVAGNPFDPRVFNGSFDSNGGHVRVYTMYNRQYVGYYQHNVDGPLTWINNGDTIRPNLEKFLFKQMSTINNDGFYGDHLRHIPVRQTDSTNEYITLTRDWLNEYRWCYTTVALDTEVAPVTAAGRNIGPKRITNEWFDPPSGGIPSFVVSNEESADVISSLPHVFNTQNQFKGYGTYQLSTDTKNPISFSGVLDIDDAILNWVAINGGGWTTSHKQLFYYRNQLFWFSQTTSAAEIKADGTDCYYGVITNIIIETVGAKTVLKVNGDVAANATVKPLKVNTKATLSIDRKTINGLDSFDATDIYIMRTGVAAGVTTRLCMVNLGPFNNIYLPFNITSNAAGVYDINPVASGHLDPFFTYGANGFAVDYDKLIGYGVKSPDRLHINMQSPVMLNKMMWTLGKTPGNYQLFSETRGPLITNNGIMNNYEGACIYPVGSIVTVGGSNVPIKKPLIANTSDYPDDELMVTLDGSIPVLYSKQNNPKGYPIEPNSGCVPAGFIQGTTFRYFDSDGWKNSLLPVIDGFAMNFYGYGSSFPAFMGTFGAQAPINRFFLQQKATVLTWNTTVGRKINIGAGSNVTIKVNSAVQSYDGSGVFNIPGSFTGNVTVEITGMSSYVWSAGLVEIVQFGSLISSLNFAGCAAFKCTPTPPASIKNYTGLFAGTTAASIDGMQNWNVSGVTNMSGMFQGAVNFNQNLNNWNTSNVTNMSSMFRGCTVYNQPMGNWNVAKVETFENMFRDAQAFNQALPWNTARCWVFRGMFRGALAFNGNISNWNVSSGGDFSYMFEGCTAFNIALQSWRPAAATTMKGMFKNTTAFNSLLTGWYFPVLLDVSEMFMNAKAFNRPLAGWDTGSWINTMSMFEGTVAFGANGECPLSNFNMSKVTNAYRMFNSSNFNSAISGWSFGSAANIAEMFGITANFNQPIADWDVSSVLNAANMFNHAAAYNQDMVGMDWSSCEDFTGMFQETTVFDGDLSNWTFMETGEIVTESMFAGAKAFTGKGLETWTTSNFVNMKGMFKSALVFNGEVTLWDVSKVTTFFETFYEATAFNQILSSWTPVSGTNFRNMFRLAILFNCDLENWDMSNATDISDMFREAAAFNGLVGTWNTSNVTAMNGVFVSAVSFNQDVGEWDVSKVTNFTQMFGGTHLFNQDISGWDTSEATTMEGMFNSAIAFNQDLSGWNVSKVTNHVNFDNNTTAWVLPKPNFPS